MTEGYDAIVIGLGAMGSAAAYHLANRGQRVLGLDAFEEGHETGFGTLGYGLPAGIGAKVGNPSRPVVALLGDGGVMFTVQELATAAELGIALLVVVVDNSGYGEIRNEMVDRSDPVHAVTFPAPDFAALGRSVGCDGVTVTDLTDLGPAVAAALEADRPTVVHVRMPEGGTP